MNLKQGLDERVHDLFIEGFYAGEYQAGQKVDPAVLAQQFSISRTPVIQALKRLTTEGILTVSSGGKYFIPMPTKKLLYEVCDMRCLLEQHAVSIHIRNKDENVRKQLEGIANQCMEAMKGDRMVNSVKRDLEFHRRLVELTGNRCLLEAYTPILNRYVSIKYSLGHQYDTQEIASKRHLEIMQYLMEGNEKEAHHSVWMHIEYARQIMEGLMDESSEQP